MSGSDEDQAAVDQSSRSSAGRPRLERHLFDEVHAVDCPCGDPSAADRGLTDLRFATWKKVRYYRDVVVKK